MKKRLLILLTLVSCSSHESPTITKIYHCGLVGTIDDRLKDCSELAGYQSLDFALVTRTIDGEEVNLDLRTGLLWSGSVPTPLNFLAATTACKRGNKISAGLNELNWRLPSVKEYKKVITSTNFHSLPNMQAIFWTSSKKALKTYEVYDGMENNFKAYKSSFELNARCVADTSK